MKEFAIADLHIGQESMCTYAAADGSKLRPWDSAEEMDAALIANWNAAVAPEDKVYVFGDTTGAKGVKAALHKYEVIQHIRLRR